MDDVFAGALAMFFVCGGAGAILGSIHFMKNYGSPQDNYRESFDRTIECREKVKTQNVDLICGKIPQWSEFVKGDEK